MVLIIYQTPIQFLLEIFQLPLRPAQHNTGQDLCDTNAPIPFAPIVATGAAVGSRQLVGNARYDTIRTLFTCSQKYQVASQIDEFPHQEKHQEAAGLFSLDKLK